MATEYVYVSGKGSWIRCHNPDKFNKWSATIHPNPESLEKIRELQSEGVKNVMKKDEDGYYINFSRPTSKTFNGVVKGFAPPLLIDRQEKPIEVPVGNGSDVTLKLEVYSYVPKDTGGKRTKAARLLSVIVDNLVPFTPRSDFTDEEQKTIAGLKDTPEQLW